MEFTASTKLGDQITTRPSGPVVHTGGQVENRQEKARRLFFEKVSKVMQTVTSSYKKSGS